MKFSTMILFVLVAGLAGAGGWWTARYTASLHSGQTPAAIESSRRILYYQSAMHPWIKSDRPGKCTICGMDLVPVLEGQAGFSVATNVVTLDSNSITVLHLQTTEIKLQPLKRTLRVAGVIDDDDTRHRFISAYLDGRVDELLVNYVGAEVVAGQPLATFYSPMLRAAGQEYVSLVRARPNPALEVERTRMIDAATERLLRLGLSREQIAALPEKPESDRQSQILAPITGSVVARNVYAGQYVKEGDRLFEIADFSRMWFQFDAYERDLAWLQVGQGIEVTVPSVPGRIFTAKINFIDPNLTDQSRSAKIRVEIENQWINSDGRKQREILHRVYAEGLVTIESREVLTVPRTAVLSPGGRALVYVEKGGGAFEARMVQLGRAGDNAWEVLAGLVAGERVVTTGNLLLDAQAQLMP